MNTTFYDANNLLYFTIPKLVMKQNSDGIWKKNPRGVPMNWTEFDKQQCEKNTNRKRDAVLCLMTGEKSKITVIDIDATQTYRLMAEKHPEIKSWKTTKTKKGYHLFFKYDARLKTNSQVSEEYLKRYRFRNHGQFSG